MSFGDFLPNLLVGRVRGTSRPSYGEGDSRLGINDGGETLVAQALPPKTELVRLGNSFSMAIPTASAFTHVADQPTTRAELALYNGEPGNGKSYIVDSVWWYSLTSIAAASGATLIYQVGFPTALSDNTAILINSPVGRTYGGRAKRALAVTTMTANKWSALAALGAGPAASIGTGLVAEVNGGLIVPPGGTLGLNVIVSTAAGTGIIGVAWHEVTLALG